MLDWDQVSTTTDLLATRILQVKRREKNLQQAYETVRRTRQRAIEDLEKRYKQKFDFHAYEPGMYVWLRESQLETQKGNKTDWTYSGPYVIHSKRDTGSYVLRELDGAIIQGHVHAERLRLFYFRTDNQTLRSRLPSSPKVRRAKVHMTTQALSIPSYSDLHTARYSDACGVVQAHSIAEAKRSFDLGTSNSGVIYFHNPFPFR